MRYGILAHNLGKTTCDELVRRVSSYGFEFVQLALAKALSDMDTSLGRLSPGLANHVADTFARQGVRISVLGCYINPIHPNMEERRYGIERFKEHLRYARDFGASVVATETGTIQTYMEAHPERSTEELWNQLRGVVEELAEEAEKWGVTLGIEPSGTEVIHTADLMHRMLEEVPSTSIGVVIDPCHLLHAHNIERQHEVLQHAFRQLGHRIVLAHVKDMDFTPEGKKTYVRMGTGCVDYPFFMQLLRQYKPYSNVSFEGGIELEHIPASIAHLKSCL
ncbi:hypothetical protein PAESOLCIP111_06304 [Paenibacillus solanacearum]|uniref:Xylose isomerase-like TIM barrel domain-containing protein n=1 Tax=Paenibacillus solanacearum TaxID=2048548 RepID=A0A916NSU2_9BACL|nr:sugar phosphate isomerase/epimerase family protein [Paenibacillus solanacearum]CAG7651382.1 hypothetical protein PAESOLCIP111_06304 [Paenibacillus solanacearum]